MSTVTEQVANFQSAAATLSESEHGSWVTVSRQSRRLNTERQQHYPRGPKRQQQSTTQFGDRTRSGQTQSVSRRDKFGGRERTPQEGARKIWGTVKSTTTKAVERALCTIAKLPSSDFSVKRKFKNVQGNRRIIRWWFVVRADESVLQKLTESWNAVAIQTNWKLEPLLVYADKIQAHLSDSDANSDSETQPASSSNQERTNTNKSSMAESLSVQNANDSQSTSFLEDQ